MSNQDGALEPSPHGTGAIRDDRRRFLKCTASALALAPVSGVWAHTLSARTLASRTLDSRTLKFVHTHTGETLSTVYYRDGGYRAAELARVNHLLRDFRTGDVHRIDPAVLDILFDLQRLADRDEPFQVVSGYRSPRTNEELREHTSGVAAHSLHIQGRAIDVRLTGFPTHKLHGLALGMRRGGVGLYTRSDFVHLDNGRVRCWGC